MGKVEVHPLFFIDFDRSDAEDMRLGNDLAELFCDYWKRQGHPGFGKDVTYDDPKGSIVTEVVLRHVHLEPLEPTKEEIISWRKPDPRWRTSNRVMIYTRSECGRALLLAYVEEDAHAAGRKYDFLRALSKAAQAWYHMHNIYPEERSSFLP